MDPNAQTNQPQPPPPPVVVHSNNSLIILFCVLTLILLGSTGFLYYQNLKLQSALSAYQQSQVTPSPSASPDVTANWKTYNDPNKQFSFKYPPNFSPGSGGTVMAPVTGTSKLVYAFADNSTLAQNTDQPFDGFTVYEVSAFKATSFNAYLAAELNAIQNSPMGNGKSNTMSKLTIPGINAFKITFSASIQLFYIETPDGKGAVVFSQSILNKNSETEIMQVLSTLKFISQKQLLTSNQSIILNIVNKSGGDLTPRKIVFTYDRLASDKVYLIPDQDIQNIQSGFEIDRNGIVLNISPEFEGFTTSLTNDQAVQITNANLNSGIIYRFTSENSGNYSYSTYYKAGVDKNCGDYKPNMVSCAGTNVDTVKDVSLSITCQATTNNVNNCDQIVKTMNFSWQ